MALTETSAQPNGSVVPAQEESYAGDMMALIERVATNPDVPIERLERLLEMKVQLEDRDRNLTKAMEAEEAERAFNAAMLACQEELPKVFKNKMNRQTNSSYADLASISEKAMPIIRKHGFALSFAPQGGIEAGEGVRLSYRLSHVEGHTLSGETDVPMSTTGGKGKSFMTPVHAYGSAQTYGRRYLICSLFNLITDDDDGQSARASEAPITEEQFHELRDLIERARGSEEKVLQRLGAEHLEQLTQNQFHRAKAGLLARIKQNAG